jgi:5'-3' exonuclease
MYAPTSPILNFYPMEFEQDLNGKKQEWEAVVKIPFIDEDRLLGAMACAYFSLFTYAHSSEFSTSFST